MLVMRKICMTNRTDKYIQPEPFRAQERVGSGSAFFFGFSFQAGTKGSFYTFLWWNKTKFVILQVDINI